MVDASIQMSSDLAGLGVSGVGTTQDMLSAMTQSFMKRGMDPNLATGAAMNNLAALGNKMSNQDMTMGNMIERAGLKKILPNATAFQRNRIAELKPADIQTLRKGGPQARMLAEELGIGNLGIVGNDEMLDDIGEYAIRGAIFNAGGVREHKRMVEKAKRGEKWTPEEQAIARQGGFNYEAARTIFSTDAGAYGEGLGGKKVDGYKMEQTQGHKVTTQIEEGKKKSEGYFGAGKGFEGLEKMMQAIGQVSGAEFKENVVKAAENFDVPVTKFGQHVDRIDGILKAHEKVLKSMGQDVGPVEKSAIDGRGKVKYTNKSNFVEQKSGFDPDDPLGLKDALGI